MNSQRSACSSRICSLVCQPSLSAAHCVSYRISDLIANSGSAVMPRLEFVAAAIVFATPAVPRSHHVLISHACLQEVCALLRTGAASARYVDCDDRFGLCCSKHLPLYSRVCCRMWSFVAARACATASVCEFASALCAYVVRVPCMRLFVRACMHWGCLFDAFKLCVMQHFLCSSVRCCGS